MTAKLLTKTVKSKTFEDAGLFEASDAVFEPTGTSTDDGQPISQMHAPAFTAAENAYKEGERLCKESDVEAFQVWELVSAKQRAWKLEDMEL